MAWYSGDEQACADLLKILGPLDPQGRDISMETITGLKSARKEEMMEAQEIRGASAPVPDGRGGAAKISLQASS